MNNDPSVHRGQGHLRRRGTAFCHYTSSPCLPRPAHPLVPLRKNRFSVWSEKEAANLSVFRRYLLYLLKCPSLSSSPLCFSHSRSFTFTVQCTFLFLFLENSLKRGETRPLGCRTASPLLQVSPPIPSFTVFLSHFVTLLPDLSHFRFFFFFLKSPAVSLCLSPIFL